MKKESAVRTERLNSLLQPYSRQIHAALHSLADLSGMEIFVVGGTVRDALLGLAAGDLDLTVPQGAEQCCRELIRLLGGGTFVDLGGTGEDVGRVVFHGIAVDISGFRSGADTIEDDLSRRDYTINALAVPLSALRYGGGKMILLDPLQGMADLEKGVLRCCPGAFGADPLRMLRGFRLAAILGFTLNEATLAEIRLHAEAIRRAAGERINHELAVIMESARACRTLRAMHGTGLLSRIVPELDQGLGVEQPEFHHLDVFHHSFLALDEIEKVITDPDRYYPGCSGVLGDYLSRVEFRRCLKWAALLHDIGKPGTLELMGSQGGRVTFHGHDEEGCRLVQNLAGRLKWSNEDRERTGGLIAMHMHPFHLCNVRRAEPLSKRAILKLCKRAGVDLPGLFLLAMADSLASRGEKKPIEMEAELADLFHQVLAVYENDIRPVTSGPPLLTGRDLIETFALPPGPVFAVILKEIEALRVENVIGNREEALRWVSAYLQQSDEGRQQLLNQGGSI